jgi:hypothetical protein
LSQRAAYSGESVSPMVARDARVHLRELLALLAASALVDGRRRASGARLVGREALPVLVGDVLDLVKLVRHFQPSF